MKILNLYAGVGGNRKLWKNHEITAVENNKSIAKYYKDHYPNDNIIIDDAHEFLRNNYMFFDFIWSSFPCQTHSRARYAFHKEMPVFPDLKLYEEIIFLKHYFKKDFVIENVIPYYKPLITPSFKIGRHFFWSNKRISNNNFYGENGIINVTNTKQLEGFEDLINYKFNDISLKQIIRNTIHPELGLYILDRFLDVKREYKTIKNIRQNPFF